LPRSEWPRIGQGHRWAASNASREPSRNCSVVAVRHGLLSSCGSAWARGPSRPGQHMREHAVRARRRVGSSPARSHRSLWPASNSIAPVNGPVPGGTIRRLGRQHPSGVGRLPARCEELVAPTSALRASCCLAPWATSESLRNVMPRRPAASRRPADPRQPTWSTEPGRVARNT
jgi:hypothetical protein